MNKIRNILMVAVIITCIFTTTAAAKSQIHLIVDINRNGEAPHNDKISFKDESGNPLKDRYGNNFAEIVTDENGHFEGDIPDTDEENTHHIHQYINGNKCDKDIDIDEPDVSSDERHHESEEVEDHHKGPCPPLPELPIVGLTSLGLVSLLAISRRRN